MPIDIKIGGISRAWTILQSIHPPGALTASSPMIGNNIQNQPHLMPMQLLHEFLKFLFGSNLRVEPRKIRHIVAVAASTPGLQHGRGIKVRNAERVQIWN